MKKGLSSVDVAALAAELSGILVGSRIEKAYQPAKDEILLRVRPKGLGKMDLICKIGSYITLTRVPPENPDKPSMVAQILRNDFGNGRIMAVSQVGFDRILRIDVERGDGVRSIVFELFGDGNMLLLQDGIIQLPLRGEDHGARRLRKGEVYQTPPSGTNPKGISFDEFVEKGKAAQRDIVRFLALDLGFGPFWSEELCLRAELKKNTAIPAMTPENWDSLHKQLAILFSELERDPTPSIIFSEGEMYEALPLECKKLDPEKFPRETTNTFWEALDGLFRGGRQEDEEDGIDDPRRKKFEDAKGKIQRQVDQMSDAIGGFEKEEQIRRREGDALYLHFQEVGLILDAIQKGAAQLGYLEIGKRLMQAKVEGSPSVARIESIDPHQAEAVFRLDDSDGEILVPIELKLSVQENAASRYDAGKKAKSRADGARGALDETLGKLKAIVDKGLDGFGAAPRRKAETSRHYWFETYRFTVTPSGYLAVGGRNASQNDAVVKKYMRDGDRYIHAEIHGAPSVVLRPAGRRFPDEGPSEEDLIAAGQFAAASSRAWRQFAQASAYWVTPAQVSKTPRSGEFVPRGAWIIHGKRNIMDRLNLEWAIAEIGFDQEGNPQATDAPGTTKWVGGPPAGLKPFARVMHLVKIGGREPNEVALELVEKLGITVETAQSILPPGPCEVIF